MIGTVSGISGVSYKIINNIKNNISLQLKDKSEYSAVVGKTDGLEPENNEGRGLIRGTPFALEFQTALPVVGQDDNEVLKNIKVKSVFFVKTIKTAALSQYRLCLTLYRIIR